MIFDKFPYTNFHEMNDDWIIQTMRLFAERLDEFVAMNSLTYADPIAYDPEAIYPANTVVIYNNTAYVTKRAIPAGLLPTTGGEYWLEIFPFGVLIEQCVAAGVAEGVANIPLIVNDWMNQHPEITTTVQNGSIDYPKLSSELADILLDGYEPDSMISHIIERTAFEQGKISPNDGTNAPSNSICRTGYITFTADSVIKLKAAAGFVVTIFSYTSENVFVRELMSNIQTEWTAFKAKTGYKYRLEVMNSGGVGALTPGELPATVIYYQQYLKETVDIADGSLMENKFSQTLKLKTIKDYVTPEMFRAIGDGTTDDREAIIAAFAYAYDNSKTLYFPRRTYYSSAAITVENVPNLCMDGSIIFAAGNGLQLGKVNQYIDGKEIKVNVVCRSTDFGVDNFGVKIINAINSRIDLFNVQNFSTAVVLTGDSGSSGIYGAFAYNYVSIGLLRAGYKSLVISRANGGYCNENLFIGGRLTELQSSNKIGITLTGNNNVFVKPCFENADIGVDCVFARNNKIISCRSEGATSLARFDNDSYCNDIEVGYGTAAVVSGSNPLNTVTSEDITTNGSANARFAIAFNNLVYDSGNLIEDFDIDSVVTLSAPLYCLKSSSTEDISRSVSTAYFSKSGNEVQFDANCAIGVYVDCSIAKDFLIEQGGAKTGKVVVRLYGSDGTLLDMSNLDIGSGSTYTTYYGQAIMASTYPASVVRFPDTAKKAFIGVSRLSGTSLFRILIKSKLLSSVIS